MTPDPTPSTIESLLAQARWLDALARRLVSDPHEADDIVQETWIAALKHPPHASVPMRSWLARVARNFAIQHGRGETARKKREHSVARDESSMGDTAAIDRAQTHRRLVDAVLALDEPYRSTVVLHYFDHVSITDIATRQSTPESTVRTRLSRAVGMLRARFRDEDGAAWSAAFVPLLSNAHPAPLTSATTLSTTTLIGGIAMATAWKIGVSVAAAALVAWWMWPSHSSAVVGLGAVAPNASPKELLAATESAAQNPREPLSAAAPTALPVAPSAPLADTHSLTALDVHVRWGDDGTPASGVMVGLWQVGAPDPFRNRREDRTDEHGHAHFDGVFVGNVIVMGDRGGETMVSVGSDNPATAEITIPDGMDVDGTVVDENGSPVPDARIWISEYFNQTDGHEVERSDANGRFHLRDVGEARYLAALHDGYGPSAQLLLERHPVGTHVERQFVLTRSTTIIAGFVLDETGRPVAGAVIEMRPNQRNTADESGRESWATFPPLHRITGASGAFDAADMGDGVVRITVRAVGFAPADTFAAEPADERKSIEVRLERQACVHGFVRNADGTPSEGALVLCGGYGDVAGSQTVTRADGSYRLEQLAGGLATIRVSADEKGEDDRSIEFKTGADVEWNVTLHPKGSVSGRVIDAEGKPLAGWYVWATSKRNMGNSFRSTETAGDGTFTLANWPTETDTVVVREPRALVGEPAAVVSNVKPGDPPIEVSIGPEALRSAFITGRVLDVAGHPMPDTEVVWSSLPSRQGQAVSTDDSGRFRVGPFRPGAYELDIDGKGQARKQVHDLHLAPKQELDVGDVQIERSGVLVVHVHLPKGAAPDTYLPSLTIHRVGSKDGADSMSLKDGEGRLAGLLPGEYLVHSEQGDLRMRARTNVAVDQTTTIDVDVEASTWRTVRFMLPAGTPASTFVKVRLFDSSGDDVYDGELEVHNVTEPGYLLGLVVGEYRVEARLGDGPIITMSLAVTSLEPPTVPIEMRLN